MATKKKITRVDGGSKPTNTTDEINESNKGQAKTFRIIAIIAWVVAIGLEVWAIFMLQKLPINTTTLIILIVAMLLLTMTGSFLWKKSNKLDPASESNKFKFFIQNQLGAIISTIAFLPLVILIFTNKNLSKKQKGLVGSIAAIALVVAGLTGTEFNPVSQEDMLEQTQSTNTSSGEYIYWTEFGKSYHLYSDCSYINGLRTDEIFEGTVGQAQELKNITDICDRCNARYKRETESIMLDASEIQED